ncbi:MAG: cytochrome P450, partial [Myxococcaceae bacterium]
MDTTANTLSANATVIASGPKGRPLLGNIPETRADPLAFFSKVAREYGDVVRLNLIETVHLLNHPDHVKHVLQDNHLNYEKGFGYARMEPLVGKGLLTSEGDFWKRQRRLAQPAFHRQRIAGFAELMVRHAQAMFDRWSAHPRGESIDVHAEMMRLTFGIVGDTLFSMDLLGEAEATGRALSTALEIINDRFQQFFVTPKVIPTPENLRLYRAIGVLEQMVNGIIEQRRAEPGRHGDLLDMFMEIQDADTGERMTDRQLRDEVMTMVLAGHETTANALSWTWLLLSKHPEVERKLHDEVARVLEGRVPTVADLPLLEYTMRVIHESMRLYPPAWFTSRKAIHDDVIG